MNTTESLVTEKVRPRMTYAQVLRGKTDNQTKDKINEI